MTEVSCARCGNTSGGLAQAPFPGELGAAIRDRICSHCWTEWLGMQVKLINEYRLRLSEPEHFEQLTTQMKAYLNLKGDGSAAG